MKFFRKIEYYLICKHPLIWLYRIHLIILYAIMYYVFMKILYINMGEKRYKNLLDSIMIITDVIIPIILFFWYSKKINFFISNEIYLPSINKFFTIKNFIILIFLSIILNIVSNISIYVYYLPIKKSDYFYELKFSCGILLNFILIQFLDYKRFFLFYINLILFISLDKFIGNYIITYIIYFFILFFIYKKNKIKFYLFFIFMIINFFFTLNSYLKISEFTSCLLILFFNIFLYSYLYKLFLLNKL